MSGEDAPDPATGLTIREKQAVRDTWAIVKQDIKTHAYGIFVRFFTENPSYQSNFASFKDVPLDQLIGNKRLLAHANSVLYAISSLVDNLDDPETLVEMLHKLAANHLRRGITIEMFNDLGTSLLGYLEASLGSTLMDAAAVTAWNKTYAVMLSIIQQGLDKSSASSSTK